MKEIIKKKVVKVGTSLGIVFNKQEREIYGINHDDTLKISMENESIPNTKEVLD